MRMHVPLATLGTLLDLPAGVTVVDIVITAGPISPQGVVELVLEGVSFDVDGETITAEYSVDTQGHRTFLTFKAPEVVATAPEPELTPPPVTELVGEAGAAELVGEAGAPAAPKAGKAGS